MKFLVLLSSLFILSCTSMSPKELVNMKQPQAKKINKVLEMHGDSRVDPYYWMRGRTKKDVLAYLNEENKYTKAQMSPMQSLQKKLFKEMKGRLKKKDQSVPVKMGDYFYYTRYEEKSEHPIIARKAKLSGKEEVVLDANQLAKGHSYFSLSNWKVSSNGQRIAYATDTQGRRIYTINFKDLKTGKTLSFKIDKVTNNFTWAEDNKTLFYTVQHPKTLRYEWIYRFDINSQQKQIVYHEKDEKFYTYVWKTRSDKFIVIGSGSSESNEAWLIPADKPTEKPRLFAKRRKKHEFDIDDAGNYFIIKSNSRAKNFKIFKTPNHIKTAERYWKTLVPHRKSVLIESALAFKNYFVFGIRKNGFKEIEILNRKTGRRLIMSQKEPSHVVDIDNNPNFDTDFLRYSYQSLTTPTTIIDYKYADGQKTIRKVQEVLGGFKASDYESKQVFAKAKDGVRVPISLVYKRGLKLDGSNPTLLYGYGSYGFSMEPWFRSSRLSLLDRGFVFAIAHIRGGSEMGRHWYLNGKFLKKKNTFTDFIAAAETLIKQKYTQASRLYAMGGSAGGLLMGAVINKRPDLFNGIVAQVPFVDVLTTMLDESIPLTTNEFEEWGNPKNKTYYKYIKSYSPYDNIRRQNYPHMLVTSGLHDSQVQYWEPTKWVAKLRDMKTGKSLLLLDTNMEAGHSGKSGRFKKLSDTARDFSFLLYLDKLQF